MLLAPYFLHPQMLILKPIFFATSGKRYGATPFSPVCDKIMPPWIYQLLYIHFLRNFPKNLANA